MKNITEDDIEKIKELIVLYDSLIYGANNNYGLLHCLDGYYQDAFDDEIDAIDSLKNKIKIFDNERD